MQREIERVQSRGLIYLKGGQDVRVITDLALAKGVSQPMFIRVEPSAGVKPGDSYAFTVVLRSGPDHMPVGGSTYRFECVHPPWRNSQPRSRGGQSPGLRRVPVLPVLSGMRGLVKLPGCEHGHATMIM